MWCGWGGHLCHWLCIQVRGQVIKIASLLSPSLGFTAPFFWLHCRTFDSWKSITALLPKGGSLARLTLSQSTHPQPQPLETPTQFWFPEGPAWPCPPGKKFRWSLWFEEMLSCIWCYSFVPTAAFCPMSTLQSPQPPFCTQLRQIQAWARVNSPWWCAFRRHQHWSRQFPG